MAGSRRSLVPLLGLAPWRRAPLGLRRHPSLLVALLLTGFVLGLAASSGPLFLSATGSAALSRNAAGACVEETRPALSNPAVHDRQVTGRNDYRPQVGTDIERGDRLVRTVFAERGLPDPYRVLVSDLPLPPDDRTGWESLTGFSRADALDHVEILAGDPTVPGAWLPDRFARASGLTVGDDLVLAYGTVPVAGIYRDFSGDSFLSTVPDYWCAWADLLLPDLEQRSPPLILLDPDSLYSLVPVLEDQGGTAPEILAWWYAPVDVDRLGLVRSRSLVTSIDGLGRIVRDRALADRLGPGGGYDRADRLNAEVAAAEATRSSLRGPVQPLSVAATAVALLLVVAAGGLWVRQRRREVGLLRARGVPAPAIGAKAAVESVLAVAAGALAGWALAPTLVGLVAPSQLVEPGARATAAQAVAAAVLLGLVALAVVATVTAARPETADRRGIPWRWVPWELAPLAAAWLVLSDVEEAGGARVFGATVDLDARLIVFPLFALVGAVGVAARLFGWLLPRARRHSGRWPTAPWLAVRGLSGGRGVLLSVLVVTALPWGVLTYSGGLTGSLAASVAAKAAIYNGADETLDLRATAGVEPDIDLDGLGTYVNVVRAAMVDGRATALLGIEPDRFGEFARWDDDVVGASPDDLLAPLRPAEVAPGSVPAILVAFGDDDDAARLDLFRSSLRIVPVARVDAFPGQRAPNQPMVVVDRTLLGDADRYAGRQIEVWTDDRRAPALDRLLGTAGVGVERQQDDRSFVGATDLLPVTWSFTYLQAVAGLAGSIALAALLLYVAVRQRHRFAAHHLGGRMGLRPGLRRRALALEFGGVLGPAWLAGSAVGIGCVQLTYRLLDLNPTFPPPPRFDVPLGTLASTAVVTLLAVGLAVAVAEAAARATRAADVLRVA